MKKLIALFLSLLLLAVAAVYIAVPGEVSIKNSVAIAGSSAGIGRALLSGKTWVQMWKNTNGRHLAATKFGYPAYVYKSDTFSVLKPLQNGLQILIHGDGHQDTSLLTVIPLRNDSAELDWLLSRSTSLQPLARWQRYERAKGLNNVTAELIKRFGEELAKPETVYNIPIAEGSVSDSFLITTTQIFNHYPTSSDVYRLVEKLQVYARDNGALFTPNPLLNTTALGSLHYKTMVGLPVNKRLMASSDISFKNMVHGNFMITTVTGGNKTIAQAYNQMENYFQDFRKTAMAIPFEVLITDRMKEQDSSRWITKIYFPVM